MRPAHEPSVIRRDSGGSAGGAGPLAVRCLAAAVLGTVGFYVSVLVAYGLAEADMSSPETYATMFPPREYIIVAIAAVTSVIAFLAIAKGGIHRTIMEERAAGWLVLCPFILLALIVVRGLVIDLAYSPIHYGHDWSIQDYSFLFTAPLLGAAYVVDGVCLFAISMLLSKGIAEAPREAGLRP